MGIHDPHGKFKGNGVAQYNIGLQGECDAACSKIIL